MNRTRHLRLATATLALLVAHTPAPAALAAAPTPASGTTWGQNQRVDFRWREGAEPPAWARPAIKAAAADSNASRKAKAAIYAYDAAGASTVAYTTDMPTNYAIGYAVRNIPRLFAIKIRPHGTRLDWGTLRWCQFYTEPPNGCYDLETVALHEFGHTQTMGHVVERDVDQWTDSIMHASARSKARTGWNQDRYGRCDVARLQIRYSPLNTGTLISTCLSLATDLSLTTSASIAASGASITFTAKLKVSSSEVYPMLAGGALTARSVVLQRRSPGSATWSTVTALSPVTDSTGRYVKTLTLTSTYDWRALFSAPADEGLKGTASNASRVSISITGAASQ
jgi:hypothetical protein